MSATPVPGKKRSQSWYAGVSFHKGAWVARWEQAYLGRFPQEQLAAAAVAAASGKSKHDLLLPTRLTAAFSAVVPAYVEVGAVPGDLAATYELASAHLDMYQALPALEVWSIQGKYRPWKIALYEAWVAEGRPQHCPGPGGPSIGVWKSRLSRRLQLPASGSAAVAAAVAAEAGSGQLLWSILRRAAAAMHRVDISVWADNCGRNVSFHSGWLAVLLALGVVRKHPDSQASGPGVLALGKQQQAYRLAPARLTSKRRRCFEVLQAAARALQAVHARPCRRAKEWRHKLRRSLEVLRRFQPLHLTSGPRP